MDESVFKIRIIILIIFILFISIVLFGIRFEKRRISKIKKILPNEIKDIADKMLLEGAVRSSGIVKDVIYTNEIIKVHSIEYCELEVIFTVNDKGNQIEFESTILADPNKTIEIGSTIPVVVDYLTGKSLITL